MRVAIKFLFILYIGIAGCSAMPANNYSSVDKWENPDFYQVDSSAYPTYKIGKPIFDPPSIMADGMSYKKPMTEISADDIWYVTHKYREYRYIYSDSYQSRQEQLQKKVLVGSYTSLYHLPIDKSGKVIGGWVLFKNKKQVLLSSERKLVLDPNYWSNPEWEDKPYFIEQVK